MTGDRERVTAERHAPEDLTFLRERGFSETADEIERLHAVEDKIKNLKAIIDIRLNNYLCDMQPNYDDSITGFNEAWDIVREAFAEVARIDAKEEKG